MQQIEGGAPLPSQSYKAPICSECWKDVGMVSQKGEKQGQHQRVSTLYVGMMLTRPLAHYSKMRLL